MYTYKDAIVIGREISSQWKSVDISNVMLREIYNLYYRAYATVYNSFTETDIYVNLEYYRTAYASSDMTLNEWLLTMVSTPLMVVDELPTASLVSARYANAVLTGYKIELARHGYSSPVELPTSDLYDLRLSRPQYPTNLELVKTHCIASVNGFFHRMDYDGKNPFILGGGTTASKMRCSHTGILSFLDIGKVNTYRIQESQIYPLTTGAPLKEGIILKAPVDLTNKSVLLVLGGYLVQPEKNVFFQNSDSTWVLNIMGLPYYERIQESEPLLDLSSMKIEHLDTNVNNAIVLDSIVSDKALKAYLTLSQSFFVVVDTPELYLEKITVRASNIPGLITAYENPTYPLIMGYGKHIEYSKIAEENYWALRVADEWYVRYAWQTAPQRGNKVITNHFRTWQPYMRSQAYLLNIRGKKKA